MALTMSDVDRFEAARPRLEAIAYRLLGSASEAEDAVQETFLRWQAGRRRAHRGARGLADQGPHQLCLNQLTSARARRETYVGQWLPEPLLAGDPMLGPADTAEQRESVSYAVLVLLERLSPNERAVYVLREAFAYSHREIAAILDISEAASQQIFHRAKKHVAEGRRGPHRDRRGRRTADRRGVPRGGDQRRGPSRSYGCSPRTPSRSATAAGRSRPARRRSRGHSRSRRSCAGLFKPGKAKRALIGGSPDVYAATANGDPAVVAVVDGRVVGVICLEVTAEGIAAVRSQVNPDKLERATERWAAGEHGEPGPATPSDAG